ncbi:glycosyltransferase [Kocuria sp. CPCC 205261]|uniref:glycosyltransferase n=1 Tax=Kocuria sp. CPCC 205261 TaxID=3073554 RepID=UPI0034D3C617
MTRLHEAQVSVVIGFRDWGTRRLGLVIAQLFEAFGELRGEVVVSDYGSADPASNRQVCETAGARWVYTDIDGPWSRSRALNTGFAHCSGDVVICTDADMLFAPSSIEKLYELIAANPSVTALLECRDLPPSITEEMLESSGPDWRLFEGLSRLRGRWGMGGMIAVSRTTLEKVRGLDERMHTYGCEDIDFGERTQRAGNRLMWVEDPAIRMYHLWHPSPDRSNQLSKAFQEAISYNRNILYNDASVVRNLTNWKGQSYAKRPSVTVAVATRDRSSLLRETVYSVLAQSMQDFEIVVVDDGGTDDTREILEAFEDPRIRYFRQECQGISAARNRITKEARGHFIAVIDDDDLMPPLRLEQQIGAITEGVGLVYGSFVNFDDASGDMKLFSEQDITFGTALQKGGAPGHSTWLVDKRVFDEFAYDESISSGEDNELFLRLMRAGVVMAHCGHIVAMRRLHLRQVTKTDNAYHEAQARMNFVYLAFGIPSETRHTLRADAGKKPWIDVLQGAKLHDVCGAWLPDHLVCRRGLVWASREDICQVLDEGRIVPSAVTYRSANNQPWVSLSLVESLSYADMARLRIAGHAFDVLEHWPADGVDPAAASRDLLAYVGGPPLHGSEPVLAATGPLGPILETVPDLVDCFQLRDARSDDDIVTVVAEGSALETYVRNALDIITTAAGEVSVFNMPSRDEALKLIRTAVKESL